MIDDTNPEENQKWQTYFKVGAGLFLLTSILIYKIVTNDDNENNNVADKIRIYDEDEFVQTKYAGQIEPELDSIREDIQKLKKENAKLRDENKKLNYQNDYREKPSNYNRDEHNLYKNFPKPPSFKRESRYKADNSLNTKIPQFKAVKITKISNPITIEEIEVNDDDTNSKNSSSKKKDKLYLPSGSILKLKLLSKIHANTMSKAASTPVPALFKVTDLAILPNRATLDINECFVKAEARGSLSSESVYIRSNFLSCVTNDGRIIDTKISGAAIIPGTIISKQGKMLGYSLIAGFVDGWAKISQSQYTTTMASAIGTTETSNATGTTDKLKAASYGGASQASSSMSKFYMDMVANLEPIIEVLADQDIDMMITKGSFLEFKELKENEKKISSK